MDLEEFPARPLHFSKAEQPRMIWSVSEDGKLTLGEHITPRDVAESIRAEFAKLGGNHPDDFAVDQFAAALKAKMAASRLKGRSGWNDPLLCSVDLLRRLLVKAVRKGDPVDVGNFAMMLFKREAKTILPNLADDNDKQIAIVDAARQQRLERRLQNVPVEFERRAGGDRRAHPIKD